MVTAAENAFGDEFKYPVEKGARRISVHRISDRSLDEVLFGITPPHPRILFRAFYGLRWVTTLARINARTKTAIYQLTKGGRRCLPRYLLRAMIASARDSKRSRDWEAQQRAYFEKWLAHEIERRDAVARWSELYLSGVVALPAGYRFASDRHVKRHMRLWGQNRKHTED